MTIPLGNNRPLGRLDSNGRVIPDSYNDESFRGEYDGSNNLIYKSFARPGADTAHRVWQVSKLTYDGSQNVLTIKWPGLLVKQAAIVTQTVGTVTTPWTSFSGTLSTLPIQKGTVVITVSTVTFTDGLQDGTLTGTGSNTGTINYGTGAISLSFSPAFGGNQSVVANYYVYTSTGGASNDYVFSWDERASYTYT